MFTQSSLRYSAFFESSPLSWSDCGAELRAPASTDISVTCGTMSIDLAILICPAMYCGYNESLLILNGVVDDPACKGTLDDSVSPRVLRFNFSINKVNSCGSVFKTISAPGTGIFNDFSNVQTVNISGLVLSSDPSTGTVSYKSKLKYFFSCAYPLQYITYNSQISVSASSISVQDSNGTFTSTLSVGLFTDASFTIPMVFPKMGVGLKTPIYTQVKATNLSTNYHVFLHRCYATVTPLSQSSMTYDLFVPCSLRKNTIIHQNGNGHHARFSFPAFRFIEQQNRKTSTYFIHCLIRLCERGSCAILLQCKNRRRRTAVSGAQDEQTEFMTVSSPAIMIRADGNVTLSSFLFHVEQSVFYRILCIVLWQVIVLNVYVNFSVS
uniref:ZP domain-containing protein n=1 Tax=Esox lucius TaxID=8010 RepID=A0A3P9A7U3_ESOLU